MATMLNVYDRQTRKKTAVLQNAYDIIETHELNQIYSLSFSLPSTDEKNKYCLPRHFVRWGDDGELYRIKTPVQNDSDVGTITYECEHVITTLCDSVLFGSVNTAEKLNNISTSNTITWLLSQQKQQDWTLDVCDFDRKFEYLWEQENILNALYSIPREFASPYRWSFDTINYPWKISLKVIDTSVKPEFYLRARSNILSSGTAADYANICTRIYPLGYGEGVNQLTIKEATVDKDSVTRVTRNNKPININGIVSDAQNAIKYDNTYIESPAAIVDKYGIVEKVLVDRRFEHANTLFAYAQSMLDLYQEPSMSRTFNVTDLYPLTSYDWNDAEVGKICRMTEDNTTAYITKCKWQRDKAGDLEIDLSTKATDIASNVADLADRVRIESVYAQGATQLYQHSKDANATPKKGMIISLYFPSEMRQINKVLMRLKLDKFRAYSKTTDNNGGFTRTLSVAESSKEITSQTNIGNESVNVIAKSVTTTSQTNTGNETVTVKTQSNIVTVGMEAGANQNLTTTRGGGGSGTTSAIIGDNTIDIDATTLPQWSNTENYTTTDPTSNGSVEIAGIDEKYYGGTYSYDVDGYHKHSYYGSIGQDVIGGGGHDHMVSVNVPYKNKEVIVNDWHASDGGKAHMHTIALNGFTHHHGINLSKVGNHSHSFTVNDHEHAINIGHTHKVTVPSQTLSVPCPKHTHGFTVPAQTLNVPCPKHKHQITIPGWTKTITIDPHSHGIAAGIYESGNPTAFDIYIGNKKMATVNEKSYNGDITTWLLNDQNQIPRNTWIDMEIRPNDNAYVISSVFIQGFVQSRGGGNY